MLLHYFYALAAKRGTFDSGRSHYFVSNESRVPAGLTALHCVALLHCYLPHRVVFGSLSSESKEEKQIRKSWLSAGLTAVCCVELPILC